MKSTKIPPKPALGSALAKMTLAERHEVAGRCDTSAGHLRNIACGFSTCAPALALRLERELGISRKQLVPAWRDLWPDFGRKP